MQDLKSYFYPAIELPTHALLHFEVDDSVCAVPVKRIVHPPLPELRKGCACRIRWNTKKEFDATVLCLGKDLFEAHLFIRINNFVLSFR